MGPLEYLFDAGTALTAVVLASGTIRDHLRCRDRARRSLATAMSMLAAVLVLDPFAEIWDLWEVPAFLAMTMVLFMGAGYALLRYRDEFLHATGIARRLPRSVHLAVLGGLVVSGVAGASVEGSAAAGPPSIGGSVAILGAFALWGFCVGEPGVRFLVAARDRPRVQRSRLRLMAAGYAGVVALLLLMGVSSVVSGEEAWDSAGGIALELFSIPLMLLLWAAFVPPRWLRRAWRDGTERELMEATTELLIFSPDRSVLAGRALDGALGLVGSERGFVLAPDGQVIAQHGLDAPTINRFVAHLRGTEQPKIRRLPAGAGQAIVLPLRTQTGSGLLVVLSGPLTSFFGADELSRLALYATSVSLAMDRVRLDEMKDAFLTAVSHELRTPLTSIIGFSHTLERPGIEEEMRTRLVERLRANAGRLDILVRDLLDIDKLSRGIVRPRLAPVEMEPLITEVVGEADPGERRIELRVDPIVVDADAGHVRRIVEGLVANAVKHTPSTARIWIGLRRTHEGALLTVEDNGPGIPDGLRVAVFSAFSQGPAAPRHSPGTGVGLTLVSRFAELHGGRAWVEERLGGGASFRVLLPYHPFQDTVTGGEAMRSRVQPVVAASVRVRSHPPAFGTQPAT